MEYRIRIEQDSDAENPFDNDEGMGTFYSFHRHSSNRAKGIEELENNQDAVPLSVYSHSGEHWSVKNELPGIMQCPWDSVNVAGVWCPNDVLMDELKGLTGQERKDKCLLFARQAMGVLNQYLSGDVWGYIIEQNNHCDKCQHDDWETVESCFGYYGHDECEKEAKSVLEYLTKKAA